MKSRREKNKIHREGVIKNNNLIKTSQAKELERLTFEVEEKDDKHKELSNLYNNLFERFELAQKGINELNDSNESLQNNWHLVLKFLTSLTRKLKQNEINLGVKKWF